MSAAGKDCDDPLLHQYGCNRRSHEWWRDWTRQKFCQSSCWAIGAGYEGDVCNSEQDRRMVRAPPESFAGHSYIEQPELTAYRDEDSCGQMGTDYQSHLCHGLQMSELGCKSPVLTEYCDSGTATLLATQGDGASYSSVSIVGCRYAFLAQYVCGEASIVTGFCRYADDQSEHLSANSTIVLPDDMEAKEQSCKGQCQSHGDCTAYSFSSDNSHCDLYKGGPYTYGSGRAGTTCNILLPEDQLDGIDIQPGDGEVLKPSPQEEVSMATSFGTSLVILATVVVMSS